MNQFDEPTDEHLQPTPIINSEHADIEAYAKRKTKGAEDSVAKVVRLYYAVRDGIWYDPYYPFYRAENYRASSVLKSGRGYCVSKASLLCALGRASGIPSRIGFATVRNHLATKQLLERLGSDLFVYHGYTEFFLDGKWVIATPAFNKELCQKHKVPPLEFNGCEDSIFQPYNAEQKQFMEYVDYHGSFADIPVDIIVAAWKAAYGAERVAGWIAEFEKTGEISKRDFYQEEVVKI